jgi:cytosine/uracil/thiamine/allantoin permease
LSAYQVATEPLGLPIEWYYEWIIRTIYFIVMWAIKYGVIWIGKFVVAHKIQVAIGICSIVIAAKLFIWIKERNELVRVSVKVEENDNQ